MSARDCLPITLFIARRKLLSAKVNFPLLAGFLILLAFFWIKGGFLLSFRLFLFFFPYVFLFLAQDMVKDEADSGALENILFLEGGFKTYLLLKSVVAAAAALTLGLPLLALYSFYGLVTHRFCLFLLLQFGGGILAGVYYLALAGLLSFYLKAGTNVLLVILGQSLLFLGLLTSAAQRPEWLERMGPPPSAGLASPLEFLAMTVVLPNVVIFRAPWFSVLGLGVLTGFCFALQVAKARSLELRK